VDWCILCGSGIDPRLQGVAPSKRISPTPITLALCSFIYLLDYLPRFGRHASTGESLGTFRHVHVVADRSRFLGALTNDNRKLANFAGFYKGVQSAGSAVIFRVNTLAVSSVNELVVCWVLLAGSLLIATSTVIRKVQDRVE